MRLENQLKSNFDILYTLAGTIRTKALHWRLSRRFVEAVERRDPAIYHMSLALFCILALSFSISPFFNAVTGRLNKDYDLWQQVGSIVADGEAIYPTSPHRLFPFMYPPAAAVMMAPFASLPRPAFVTLLLAIQTAAWAFCIYASVKLCTGRFKQAHPALYMLPSLLVIPFISDMYLLGQPAVLLLALSLGSFLALRKHRPELSGFLVATATAMKAYPLILLGYFLYRKQFRASCAILGGIFFYLTIFPLSYRSTDQANQDFRLWARGMLLKYDDRSIGQRPDRAFSFKNQSLQATVHRLSRPVLADGEKDRTWRVNLANLDFKRSNYLMLFSILSLGLFTMWAWWNGGKPLHTTIDATNCEQSMSLLLTVMLAPLSFNYSYVWLIFPYTFLIHILTDPSRTPSEHRSAARTLCASVGLLCLSIISTRTAAAYGNIFFAGLVVFLGIGLWERRGTFTKSPVISELYKGPRQKRARNQKRESITGL